MASLCTFPGCDGPHKAQGLCNFHYRRQLKGLPLDAPRRGSVTVCTVPGCDKQHIAKGYCYTHYSRANGLVNVPLDAPVRAWTRGEVVSYAHAHRRVRDLLGPATSYECACGCGRPADDWALDNDSPNVITDENGMRYSLDPEDYSPMRTGCHIAMDRAWQRGRKG